MNDADRNGYPAHYGNSEPDWKSNEAYEYTCPVCETEHNFGSPFCSDKCYMHAMEDMHNTSLMEEYDDIH